MTTAIASDVLWDALSREAEVDEAGGRGEPKRIGELLPAVLARLGLGDAEFGREDMAETV